MKTVRDSEIYLNKRIGRALYLAAKSMSDEAESSHTTAETLAEKYILSGIEAEFPGILKLVDYCESAYEVTRRYNQDLFKEWQSKVKPK